MADLVLAILNRLEPIADKVTRRPLGEEEVQRLGTVRSQSSQSCAGVGHPQTGSRARPARWPGRFQESSCAGPAKSYSRHCAAGRGDRKSTRLNSSHVALSRI